MVAKRPKWRHMGRPNVLVILLQHCFWILSNQNDELDVSPHYRILQVVGIVGDINIHTICVFEIN